MNPVVIVDGIGIPLGINPMERFSPEEIAEHACEHVAECRDGDYGEAMCLVRMVRHGLVSLEDAGITAEELEEFRRLGIVDPAKQYLEQARQGDYDHLVDVSEWLLKDVVTEEELGFTIEEMKRFIKEDNLRTGQQAVAECRDGNYDKLVVVLLGLEREMFTPEDLGTSEHELGEFMLKRRLGPVASGNGDHS